MKRANHSTKLQGSHKHEKPAEPAAQTGKNPRDARDDEDQLRKNQDDLGVGDDHETDAMEEGNRGTYP
jgi:hypothetical protein